MSNSNFKSAFTLIELSIVLVIIGLVIGGITTGSSLIKQAQMKAVVNEINMFKTAINTFQIQFNSLPGDMNNATAFWYNATTCPGTTGTAGSCNGNNNGLIEVTGHTTSDEGVRAWQHLTLAEVLPGSYTGIRNSGWNQVAGVNVPSSKFPNAIYYFLSSLYNGTTGNSIIFTPQNGLLTPRESYDLDIKMDDGRPLTGKILVEWTGGLGSCGYNVTNSYNINLTNPLCHSQFVLD
jgi:prepilin-type N-terminal cleavage/methylation domain-containing protein